MSDPVDALFSQNGDVFSKKKRNNLSHPPKEVISIRKSLGLIQDNEIPEEYSNIEDNGKSPNDLNEERKSAEVEVWLSTGDCEDGKEDVDISTAPQVFGE